MKEKTREKQHEERKTHTHAIQAMHPKNQKESLTWSVEMKEKTREKQHEERKTHTHAIQAMHPKNQKESLTS